MTVFKVSWKEEVTITAKIEAETEDEAIDLAKQGEFDSFTYDTSDVDMDSFEAELSQ